MRCGRVEFVYVWHVHVKQVLVDAHDTQPRWRVLGSPPLSAVIHATVLHLLLGCQAQLPCEGTNLPTRIDVVEAVGIARFTAWHAYNEARSLAQKKGPVVTGAKVGVVIVVKVALVLLRCRLPYAYAVRLAAVAPCARPAAIYLQARQRWPAITRLLHVGQRGQAQTLRIGNNIAPLVLAKVVVLCAAQMLAELGWRNATLTLCADEHAPFVEVQQPARHRLR